MADIMTMGTNFPEEVVNQIFTKVTGHSALAKLSGQIPIAFAGNDIFTFQMDKEAALVAESGKKEVGGAELAPVKIAPVKIEYGARLTDEFMNATEEKQLDIMSAYTDGCAKKFARALDIMSFHGVNPRDGVASDLISGKSFDTLVTNKVTYAAATPDDNVDDAIALIGDTSDVNGIAMAPAFKVALAKMKNTTGARLYPELGWGSTMTSIQGLPADSNSTVSFGTSKDRAIVGDFQNRFKWGYAKTMTFEVIQYGDPDNTGKDLKGYNQIYLRCEAYIGFGILDAAGFARIEATA